MRYRPIPCPNKAEPGAGHNVDWEPSQSTDGNESRHDWSKHPKHAIGECNCDRVAGEHGRGAEDGQVGHVSGHVDEGDERERYVDGPGRCGLVFRLNTETNLPWQINIWFSQFFSHEVEIVPSCVAEYSRIEGDRNLARIRGCALWWNGGTIIAVRRGFSEKKEIVEVRCLSSRKFLPPRDSRTLLGLVVCRAPYNLPQWSAQGRAVWPPG